jgi:hypothetical protein
MGLEKNLLEEKIPRSPSNRLRQKFRTKAV